MCNFPKEKTQNKKIFSCLREREGERATLELKSRQHTRFLSLSLECVCVEEDAIGLEKWK